jgi:phage terminase large subunit-like protein
LTEAIGNYMLFLAATIPGFLGVIFSKTQDDTSEIAKRLRVQVEGLHEYIGTTTDSLKDLTLTNGGRILFRNSTPNGARGLASVSMILFDEASFTDDIDAIYGAAIPSTTVLGDRARIVILSTPNAQSGWYFDKLNENNGDIDFLQTCKDICEQKIDPVQVWHDSEGVAKIIIHWRSHPTYKLQNDYLERVAQRTGLSQSQVNQEYGLSFTDSDESVFQPILIRQAATLESLIATTEENCSYFIGVDGSGQGNDYTVAMVIKWDRFAGNYSLVDMYRKRTESTDYDCSRIADLIAKYSPLAIGCETNAMGYQYIEQLIKLCPDARIEGIHTSQDSKIMAAGRVQLLLERGALLLPAKGIIVDELLSYRRQGKKLGAIAGKHDDTVMALFFALTFSPFLFAGGQVSGQ